MALRRALSDSLKNSHIAEISNHGKYSEVGSR